MCTNTLSDEEMTKVKVVDGDEYYNFYFHDFLIPNHWCLKILFEVVIS
jgi:hypothetical protein